MTFPAGSHGMLGLLKVGSLRAVCGRGLNKWLRV